MEKALQFDGLGQGHAGGNTEAGKTKRRMRKWEVCVDGEGDFKDMLN